MTARRLTSMLTRRDILSRGACSGTACLVPSALGTANASPAPGPSGAATAERSAISTTSVSLAAFGPSGRGNAAEDTAAFRRAFEFLHAKRRATPISGEGRLTYTQDSLFVPAGSYFVRGGLGAQLTMIGLWSVPGSVTITNVDPNSYFLEISQRLDSTFISGIRFIAGKGMLRHRYKGNNVSYKHLIDQCIFLDYTECAITSEAEDMPYWTITNNQFYCKADTNSRCKGVAIGGLMDNSVIAVNSFLRNNIHLQLGPFLSGNVQILDNDFLSFEKDRTDVDVWLIANDRPGFFGTNSGQATRFVGNKFGNENISSLAKKAPRLLVSASQGIDRATCIPDIGWKDGKDGSHWMQGIAFHTNRFSSANIAGSGGTGASLMEIRIQALGRVHWASDNVIDGGRYQYLFYHRDAGSRHSDRSNTNWEVRIGQGMRLDDGAAVAKAVSNRPIGPIDDPFGIVPSPTTMLPSPDPTAVSVMDTRSGPRWIVEAGVERSMAPARVEAAGATLLVWKRPGALAGIPLPDLSSFSDRLAWVVGVVKAQSAGAPLTVSVENTNDFSVALLVDLPISLDWMPVAIPFIVPRLSDPLAYQLRLTSTAKAASAGFIVDHFHVTVGRNPTLATEGRSARSN